jgi:hypothetical protein
MLNRLLDVFKSFQRDDFFVVSREDLIASKRAGGRKVGFDDVRLLELPYQEDSAT